MLHVRELASGDTWNTGLSTPEVLVGGSVFASDTMLVAPAREGQRDLNGDGDTDDAVLHVADLVTRRITNLEVASAAAQFDGGPLGFLVPEFLQGWKDLNGDGDALDAVLHVYDGVTGTVSQLGLVQDGSRTDLRLFAVSDPFVFHLVLESSQGPAIDLNGDGDVLDGVVHVYRSDTGSTRNLGLAVPNVVTPIVSGQGFAAFLVSEPQQGNADLNGDPDRNDHVTFVYDGTSDTVRNLGLAAGNLGFAESPLLEARGRWLAFQVRESSQRRDLNGDADRDDAVLHVLEVDTGMIENLRFAASDALLGERQVAFRVPEASQGNHDLTGDGDTFDPVLFVHDLATHATHGLDVYTEREYALAGDLCLFETNEFGQADLNGDGDMGDRLVRALGCASGRVVDLGLARGGFLGLARGLSAQRYALFSVDEEDQQHHDLNGDGDVSDFVVHMARLDEITRLP